jgi:hypothetical protein
VHGKRRRKREEGKGKEKAARWNGNEEGAKRGRGPVEGGPLDSLCGHSRCHQSAPDALLWLLLGTTNHLIFSPEGAPSISIVLLHCIVNRRPCRDKSLNRLCILRALLTSNGQANESITRHACSRLPPRILHEPCHLANALG